MVSQINDFILKDPQPETVTRKVSAYKDKVKVTNQAYKQLLNLTEEIKRLI